MEAGPFCVLIARWSPGTIADLALLSAYHLQLLRGYRGMSGKQIQTNLKQHGLHLSNVSVATARNMETDPPRMKKRNARGTRGNIYIVTSAGAQYVEDQLDAQEKNSTDEH